MPDEDTSLPAEPSLAELLQQAPHRKLWGAEGLNMLDDALLDVAAAAERLMFRAPERRGYPFDGELSAALDRLREVLRNG